MWQNPIFLTWSCVLQVLSLTFKGSLSPLLWEHQKTWGWSQATHNRAHKETNGSQENTNISGTLSHPLWSCSILMLDSNSEVFLPFNIRRLLNSYSIKHECWELYSNYFISHLQQLLYKQILKEKGIIIIYSYCKMHCSETHYWTNLLS